MPKTVIGVDVGAYSVKAVELRSGYKGFEVVNCAEIPHDDGSLNRLFGVTSEDAGPGLSRAVIVTALPQASLRVISLPFSDEKKIEQVAPYEIEAFIPFPLEDVVVSWHVLGGHSQRAAVDAETAKSPAGGSEVLVAAVPKSTLKDFLALFSQAGIQPRIVDLDAVVPASIFPWTDSGSSPTALVDIGGGKSTVTIFSEGRLCFARVIPFGGKDITEALRKKAKLTYEEADEEKIQNGTMGGKHRNIIVESLNQLAHHITQTFLSAEETARIKVSRLLLYGGGAKLKGLREHLSGTFHVDVDLMKIGLSLPGSHDPLIFGKALGLALREAADRKDASTINFRKGEFAFRMPREEIGGKIKIAGALIGTGLLLGLISVVVSFSMKGAVLRKINQESGRIYTTAFPGLPIPDDPLLEMQAQVSREKMRVAGESGHRSILDMLREVSSKIPKEIKVDVHEMNIDSEKIRILGATESLEAVDRIVSELKKYELFSDINVVDARRSPDGNSFNFQIAISLKAS